MVVLEEKFLDPKICRNCPLGTMSVFTKLYGKLLNSYRDIPVWIRVVDQHYARYSVFKTGYRLQRRLFMKEQLWEQR